MSDVNMKDRNRARKFKKKQVLDKRNKQRKERNEKYEQSQKEY